ncbi:MAG TPA: ATP-binding protein [Ferruginibacter sp.]|nr:ATP-binding protein [Ferruginibacter sp.]HPH90531.1 ATP-binding protein [Ferruginibacter sp.]
MINLRNISIQNKLVLIQVLTSVFVLAIFFTGFIMIDIKDYKERKVKSIQSIAKVLAANNVSTIQFQDNEAAKDILSELQNVAPDIVRAVITDTDGNTFAQFSKTKADSSWFDLGNKTFAFEGRHLYVTNPIVNAENELAGHVYIDCELSELEDMKSKKFGIAGISLVVALGCGFLIAFIIQTYVSKRLLFLVEKMKEASETNNYRLVIKDDGKDEIGILIKVYNDLMYQVNESQQRKDEFIGIASHELKTPLTSIKGYIELLNEMETRQPQQIFIQKTKESTAKLEHLIADLLDVSRINSGQLQLNIEEFKMDELIDESIDSISAGIRTDHTIIRNGTFNDLTVKGDRQRIEQVLINLLSNAVKYSPPRSDIFVSSTIKDEQLIVEIKDFGNGIPEEDKEKIFERFYRARNTSVHISGFGLGLYICSDIIKRHNGKIWVESGAKGSSFFFSLPTIKKSIPI